MLDGFRGVAWYWSFLATYLLRIGFLGLAVCFHTISCRILCVHLLCGASVVMLYYRTRSSATTEIVHDDVDFIVDDVHSALTLALPSQTDGTDEPWNGHSRSLKVIHCCANWHSIYIFLLALNSNINYIFNCSWDITPSTSIPHHSSR